MASERIRPLDVGREAWKNRHRISAKLTAEQYSALMGFCRDKDFSVNTALRVILDQHFNLTSDV